MHDPIETSMTDLVTCPWCGYQDNDSHEYDDGSEYECLECGKPFSVAVEVVVTFTTEKVEDA